MKRAFSILMMAAMLFAFSGCTLFDDSVATLKRYNVDDYLTVEVSDWELHKERFEGLSTETHYVTVSLSVKSKVEAQYSNAKLTLKVFVLEGKSTFTNEQQYELSENGEYFGEVKIPVQTGVFDAQKCYVKVLGAEGTVKLK